MRLSKFIMAIGTAVESAMNGQMAGCIDNFLKHGSSATLDPEGKGTVDRFKEALQTHIAVLDKALAISDKIVSSAMREMHTMSQRNFEKLKENLAGYL